MNASGARKYSKDYTDLTYPIIIMRQGGLDGIAMQKHEYRLLLNCLDTKVHVIVGLEETQYGQSTAEGEARTEVDRLDFYHPDSQLLFQNAFTQGPETEGIEKISEEEWLRVFHAHKNKIRDRIEKVLLDVPDNTPVIVYNLLSLRHAQPAAAVAIRELIDKYPHRGFLSHSADPDAERPEKIARIKEFVLRVISAKDPSEPYSGGPYQLNNLYHIVLNPTQKANFLNKYGIPENHVHEIPDFLEFKSGIAVVADTPEPGFMEYLAKNSVYADGDGYTYWPTPVDDETIFFLSPVRPVYRKRLKKAMIVAHEYGKTRGKKVAFVVTHPDVDDREYFAESVKFANALGLQYIHLGKNFTIDALQYVYTNMAALRTVGVVASSAGGWENALNEMAHACIPFFMSSSLNSFKPLTEEIGILTHGMNFDHLEKLIEQRPVNELTRADLSDTPGMKEVFEWIDGVLNEKNRRSLIEHNYRQAYKHLSHHATALRLWEVILKIYARHGLPGMPGQACET